MGNYIFTFFLSNNFPPFNVQCAPISIGGKHYLAVSIFPLTSLLFARQRVAKAVKRQKFHGNEGILRSKQFLPGKAVWDDAIWCILNMMIMILQLKMKEKLSVENPLKSSSLSRKVFAALAGSPWRLVGVHQRHFSARKIWKWSHGEFHELDFVIHFRSILMKIIARRIGTIILPDQMLLFTRLQILRRNQI